MHYIPRVLNNIAFKRLFSIMSDSEVEQPLKDKINHFLYRATCIVISLKKMNVAQELTVRFINEYIQQIKFDKNLEFAISAEPLFEVYSQIPATLSQIVVMQNQLLKLLQGILPLDASVPKSLNSAIKKGLDHYKIPTHICEMINDYWKNSGKYIRAVRNVNEHYVALVDYTYFNYTEKPGKILILLPDNPNEESSSKFKYNKKFNAYDIIYNGFYKLIDLTDKILASLGKESIEIKNQLTMGHMGIIENNKEKTLGLMIFQTGIKRLATGTEVELRTFEIKQVVPEVEGGGNISARMLKLDRELSDL